MISLQPWVTENRLQEARAVARGRFELAKKRNRSQPFGDPGDEKRLYVDGYSALAESLVAAWLGLTWHSELIENLSIKPPDVGSKMEVRWTKHASGHLIAHETDNDEWIMTLVRGELPQMEVVGWTTASYAKRSCFKKHPKARSENDYWVPAKKLLLAELLLQMRKGLA